MNEMAASVPCSDGPSKNKTTMSVPEMRKMLGLGKTASYWLVKKNFFQVITYAGQMRVVVESFENWYENQVKYKKVDGPPPGKKLRESSYSVDEIAEMLGVCSSNLYGILKEAGVKFILVDHWKRVPGEEFERWYSSQKRYRTKEDRERDKELEDGSIWLPDAARILGVSRKEIYNIIYSAKNRGVFDLVVIGERKRVTKESFFRWYENQQTYQLLSGEEEYLGGNNKSIQKYIMEMNQKRALSLKAPKHERFYTIKEIEEFYGVTSKTVRSWIQKGYIDALPVPRNSLLILREVFDEWYPVFKRATLSNENN